MLIPKSILAVCAAGGPYVQLMPQCLWKGNFDGGSMFREPGWLTSRELENVPTMGYRIDHEPLADNDWLCQVKTPFGFSIICKQPPGYSAFASIQEAACVLAWESGVRFPTLIPVSGPEYSTAVQFTLDDLQVTFNGLHPNARRSRKYMYEAWAMHLHKLPTLDAKAVSKQGTATWYTAPLCTMENDGLALDISAQCAIPAWLESNPYLKAKPSSGMCEWISGPVLLGPICVAPCYTDEPPYSAIAAHALPGAIRAQQLVLRVSDTEGFVPSVSIISWTLAGDAVSLMIQYTLKGLALEQRLRAFSKGHPALCGSICQFFPIWEDWQVSRDPKLWDSVLHRMAQATKFTVHEAPFSMYQPVIPSAILLSPSLDLALGNGRGSRPEIGTHLGVPEILGPQGFRALRGGKLPESARIAMAWES